MPLLILSELTRSARKLVMACTMGAALAASPSQAVVTFESGDAGQTQGSAQVTAAGAGTLTDIFGSLSSATDADLYLINITNPLAFSATTLNSTGGFLDTQLFLLTLAGAPVMLNDDAAGGLSTLSTLPAGSGFAPAGAGLYLLGVSMSGYDPMNVNGQLLFETGLPTALRGPASGLQPALLGAFADNTFFVDSGAYDIQLTGAVAAVVPEPAGGMLFALGGAMLAGTAFRRRKATATRRAA